MLKNLCKKFHPIVLLSLMVLLMSGCQTSTVKKVVSSQQCVYTHDGTNEIYLDTTKLKTVNVAFTGLGYDPNAVSQSVAIGVNSAPPGSDPLAVAIGSLIGAAIVSDMEKPAALKEKNQRVEAFLSKASTLDWQIILDKNDHLKKTWFINQSYKEGCQNISVQPELKLSADYRHFELVSLVTMMDKETIAYQNYFHVYSTPFLDKTALLSELNNLPQEQLAQEIEVLLSQLEVLIDNDLSQWQKLPMQNKAIKFRSDDKEYYDRGVVLAETDSFITYKTLRGEVKHMPYEK